MTEGESNMNRLLDSMGDLLRSIPTELRARYTERLEEEIRDAVEVERSDNLGKAAAALLDSGVKPERVIQALQKYWSISRERATRLTNQEAPARRLETYLLDRGISMVDAHALAIRLQRLLKDEPSLAQEKMETQWERAQEAYEHWQAKKQVLQGRVHVGGEW